MNMWKVISAEYKDTFEKQLNSISERYDIDKLYFATHDKMYHAVLLLKEKSK